MHVRSLVLAFVAAATACVSNPDPRGRTLEVVQRDGHGGWIVIKTRSGLPIVGELIAVEPQGLRVLTLMLPPAPVFVPKVEIASAKLWAWETQPDGLVAWGSLGAISTLSHGFLLVFSFPVWLLTTVAAPAIESRASIIEYPDDGWDKFSIWARFPQGLPSGVRDGDLIRQDRSPPTPTGPPGGTDAPAGPPSGTAPAGPPSGGGEQPGT